MTFSVADQSFQKKKKSLIFFPAKVDTGRVGVGVRVRARVRISVLR